MSDIASWFGLAGLLLTVGLAAWVRINSQIAKLDTRGISEKLTCDSQLAQLRAEIIAVEARGNASNAGLRTQLEKIDLKVDRLLERGHP